MSDENRYGDGTVFEGVRSKDSVIPTLQLAIDLEGPHGVVTCQQAAAELRRLCEENFVLASGQCLEGGPWGDEGGTPYCKLKEELKRLHEVNQELMEQLRDLSAFYDELESVYSRTIFKIKDANALLVKLEMSVGEP